MGHHRRHHPLTRQRSAVLSLGFVLVGSALAACQHAEAVQRLADEAEAARARGTGGGAGAGGGIDRTMGMSPTEALQATATPLTGNDFVEPVVDEENRMSCTDTPVRDLYISDPADVQEARGLVSQMSIDQKVIQLTGIEAPDYNDSNRWEDIQRSRDDPALNLRGYLWRDGPHGLNLEAGRGRDDLQNYSTSFPTSVAQGASFDFDLVHRIGEAMGDETLASGNTVLLGPCMNVLRHPFWGRAQETFGEDAFHLGRIGTAISLGIQEHIAGCAKHYAANNIENRRFDINAQMDEQTLREVYGRHFEMVVRDGGVACVMAAYNSVNGTKSTQNKHLLTTMLREDMGFRGFVLTDWWAMPGANTGQGPIDPPQDQLTAAAALEAGLDVEVPWTINFDALPSLASSGAIQGSLVDRAVLRVLEQKLRFNVAYLDQPIGLGAPDASYDASVGSMVNTEAHATLAGEAAQKSMVLLKNDGNVLPITSASTVAVIGATVDYTVRSDRPSNKTFNFVTDAALGDRGSSRVRPNPALTVGPLAGITAAAPSGVSVISGSTATEAQNADFVVVVVGLTPGDEGEEYTGAADRESLSLGDVHNNLVQAVAALGKPMVVVIEAGGVVDMPWLDQVDAVVMAWYPGQRGGEALGRLLFGQANFAGRLPVTWPSSVDQFPTFNEGNSTAMDYYVGYRRFDALGLAPLFAFGHGLSYSTFRYERLHIPCGNIAKNGLIHVDVDVRNTGGPAGDEVIMVFASYPETQAPRRSVKELKGFARVELGPGEGKRVRIPIRVQDLKYWDMNRNSWVVESGPVVFQVGPSSANLPLRQTVIVD